MSEQILCGISNRLLDFLEPRGSAMVLACSAPKGSWFNSPPGNQDKEEAGSCLQRLPNNSEPNGPLQQRLASKHQNACVQEEDCQPPERLVSPGAAPVSRQDPEGHSNGQLKGEAEKQETDVNGQQARRQRAKGDSLIGEHESP
jgi:hypothetical protein